MRSVTFYDLINFILREFLETQKTSYKWPTYEIFTSIKIPVPYITLWLRPVKFVVDGNCSLVLVGLSNWLFLHFQHLTELPEDSPFKVGHRLQHHQHLPVELLHFALEPMLLLKEAITNFVDVCQQMMVNLLLVQQSSMEPFQSPKVRLRQRVGPLSQEKFVGQWGYFHDELGFFGFDQVQQDRPGFEGVANPALDIFWGGGRIDELGDILLELDEGEDHFDFGLHCLHFVDGLEGVKVVDEELDGRRLLLELFEELVAKLAVEILLQQLLY